MMISLKIHSAGIKKSMKQNKRLAIVVACACGLLAYCAYPSGAFAEQLPASEDAIFNGMYMDNQGDDHPDAAADVADDYGQGMRDWEKMDDTELEVDSTEQDKGHNHAAH